jgi:uncharacterized SAM-binding protein YcdF (DUF218 family)
LLVLLVFHPLLLRASGHYLECSGPPRQAEAIVVLAGDFYGHRILRACELVREGYAPIALISGPSGSYGHYESELAIPFAVNHGCRQDWFVPIPNDCRSTRDEAYLFANELRRRRVKNYLLVTSNYHTRRAGRLFRAAAPDLPVDVVASPDEDFNPDTWWHSREARKTFAFEWMKTVAGWFGA